MQQITFHFREVNDFSARAFSWLLAGVASKTFIRLSRVCVCVLCALCVPASKHQARLAVNDDVPRSSHRSHCLVHGMYYSLSVAINLMENHPSYTQFGRIFRRSQKKISSSASFSSHLQKSPICIHSRLKWVKGTWYVSRLHHAIWLHTAIPRLHLDSLLLFAYANCVEGIFPSFPFIFNVYCVCVCVRRMLGKLDYHQHFE